MVVVKSKRDTYGKKRGYLYKALNYLYDNEKALHIGGYGVSIHNLKETYFQMLFVKKYFHKTEDNPLMHFIISFDDDVKSYDKAKLYAIKIGSFFKCRHQILWCVHRKERRNSHYHLHMIVNSVSFVDGKLYDSSPDNLCDFCKWIENVTGDDCRYYYAGQFSSDDV